MVQAVIYLEIHHGPVVQPRPAHRPVADVEAQGPDQVEAAAGGGAGPGDIAGILRDLRFDQYDVQHLGPSSLLRLLL